MGAENIMKIGLIRSVVGIARVMTPNDRFEEFNEHFLDPQEQLDRCYTCSGWLEMIPD